MVRELLMMGWWDLMTSANGNIFGVTVTASRSLWRHCNDEASHQTYHVHIMFFVLLVINLRYQLKWNYRDCKYSQNPVVVQPLFHIKLIGMLGRSHNKYAIINVPLNLWYKMRQIPKLKCFSSRHAIEARCYWRCSWSSADRPKNVFSVYTTRITAIFDGSYYPA